MVIGNDEGGEISHPRKADIEMTGWRFWVCHITYVRALFFGECRVSE